MFPPLILFPPADFGFCFLPFQAQQRYRARRKAQFEDLQETVDELNAQIKALEKERAHRQALEVEVAQLRAATAALAASVAVDGSAIATRTHPSPFSHQLPSSSNIEAVISWAESQGLDKAAPPLQALLHALSGQSMLSAPTIPSVPSNQSVPIDAANVPLLQLQEMLLAYGQELGHFATSNGITSTAAAAGYSNSSPLSQAENSLPHGVQATLDQFIKMGIELAKLVLNASGAAVEVLLHDGGAPSTHHGTADDVRRWRNVAAQVALNSQQNLRITIWRAAFLTQLDAVYNKRMQLKAQVVQATEPAQGSGMQWSEVLLLRAANSSGFALPAQAEAELFGAAEELLRNIEENRAAVVAALSNLLCTILTPVQAIRYLVASHPFSWNALAFSNVVSGSLQ